MNSEVSKAEYYGFKMECHRDQNDDPKAMRGWRVSIHRPNGEFIRDEMLMPWVSRSQAENRAVEIVTGELSKLGKPAPVDLPTWK